MNPTDKMWSEKDLEIRRKTFADLKARGICTPLGSLNFTPPPILPPEEQEKIRQFQKEHREWLAKTNPKYQKRSKAKGKYTGFGQKEAAFARALEARGFDTRNSTRISRGKFAVAFKTDEWSLSKGDEILHTQPFGAGSINVVDRVISRNGGY